MLVGTRRAIAGHPLVQDRDACLDVGRLDVDEQAPLEAGAQAVGEIRDLPRRAVRAQHELPSAGVQGVERVEELLLDAFLAGQELDVVDQEDVELLAVAALEGVDPLVLDGGDELVGEGLAGDVARTHAGRVHQHVMRDRLQQMRLAEARVAVDDERVVGLAGRLGDGQGRRVGEAVRAADHERAERVLRAQRLGRLCAATAPRRSGLGRCALGLGDEVALGHRLTVGDPEAHGDGRVGRAGGLAHQFGEVPLDPGACELVRHTDLQDVALQCERPGGREPRAENHRREVIPDAVGDRGPEEVRCGGI
jgi:hypothetical protein